MADLGVSVVHGFGRSGLMPSGPALLISLNPGELIRMVDGPPATAITLLQSVVETLRLSANFVTVIKGNTGQVAFVAAPGHSATTSYTARIRVSGSSTVSASQALGTPTPDGNNVIVVDLSSTFSGLSAGTYTVSIFASDSQGGSFDSAESAPFALPLV